MKSVIRVTGLAAATALLALVQSGPAAAAGMTQLAAATTSDLYVAVVVDFGGASGAPRAAAACVKVPPDSTDADALAAAVGQDNLGYAPSGLLCAIDGYPTDGIANCNASSDGEYFFWSYWNGKSGSWSYASAGPAATLVTPGDVEGWRYQDPGPANGSAPAPGLTAAFSSYCASEYAASTGGPATTSTTVPSTSRTTVPAPRAGGGTPTTGRPSAAPSGASTNIPGSAGPTTTAPPAHEASRGPPTTAATTTTSSTPPSSRPHRVVRALGAIPHRAATGTDWPITVAVTLLLAGLAAAAAVRWRRRTGRT